MSRLGGMLRGAGISLRSSLLAGLAVLLLAALLTLSAALVVWLPGNLSPAGLVAGVLFLVIADVAIVLVFGDFLLRRLLVGPLRRMGGDAERIAGGEHAHRLEPEGPVELRRVARSINGLAEQLIEEQELLAENVRSLDRINRSLSETRGELLHADKLASVGRLAAGVAHEVGNPLSAIMTYLDLARRGEPAGEWIEEIEREARRIDEILNGLLDYARPGKGTLRPVSPGILVRDTARLLETQGRLREIELELDLEADLPAVRANPSRLEQVLVNLLLNACEAIDEKDDAGRISVRAARRTYEGDPGPAFRPRRRDDPEEVDYSHLRRLNAPPEALRRPPFEEGESLVRIEFEDDGPGIDPDALDRVFDPFYTTKEPGRGTGLGLAVSARLIEEMGGEIEAARSPDGGSLFAVHLPIAGEE